ncbi:metallophosphoesterase family protein [Paenibacillus apiarius]|uniref:metallophosphoesterase family protein n=1 Tax=Paenibacillus apiarius TaxID=46240 RepID=UPI001F0890E3|nr:metallophosphoesterase family protein [Paenibacillus apiarius]
MNKDYTIAVISDIHSNIYALEAVLSDIDSRGIKTIVNLGDTLFGPTDPIKTAELILKRPDIINIMGNCDRYLLQEQMESVTFHYVKPVLTPEIHDWIQRRGYLKIYYSVMELLSQMTNICWRKLLHMVLLKRC